MKIRRGVLLMSLCLMILVSCNTIDDKQEKISMLIANYLNCNDSISSSYFDVGDINIVKIDSLFDDANSDTTIIDLYIDIRKDESQISEMAKAARFVAKKIGENDNRYSLSQLDRISEGISTGIVLMHSKREKVRETLENLSGEFYGWKVEIEFRKTQEENESITSDSRYMFLIDQSCHRVIRCVDMSTRNLEKISEFIDDCVQTTSILDEYNRFK